MTTLSATTRVPELRIPRLEVPQFDIAEGVAGLDRLAFDAAATFNRATTPPTVIEAREVPRLTPAEINAQSLESLHDRIRRLPRKANGVQATLDLIDLPRNAVGNLVSAALLPEARRKALESGQIGTLGLPRVYGSDLLRAAGLDNNIAAAGAGFAVDIFTDPLTYLGGVGAVKSVATRAGKGAVTYSRTGSKQLRRGLRLATEGRLAQAAPEVRDLIEATARSLDVDLADAAKIKSELSGPLLGGTARRSARNTARRALGADVPAGSVLADDVGRSVETAASAAEADRIRASKAFIQRFGNAPGIDLTGGRGGTQIAHLPFTDLALTVPAFTRRGRQAAAQMAIASTLGGKAPVAQAIMEVSDLATDIGRVSNEIASLDDELHAARAAGANVGDLPERLDEALSRHAELTGGADALADRLRLARIDLLNQTRDLDPVEDLGQLLTIYDTADRAAVQLERVRELRNWRRAASDAGFSPDFLRPLEGEPARIRELRQTARESANIDAGLNAAETVFDDLAPFDARARAADEMFRANLDYLAGNHRHLAQLVESGDPADLERAERVAEALSRNVDVAQELARLTDVSAKSLLTRDQRALGRAAARLAGLDVETIGDMPLGLGSYAAAARRLSAPGSDGVAAWFDAMGRTLGGAFGVGGGTVNDLAAFYREAKTGGASAAGERVGREVATRLERLAKAKGITDRATLRRLPTAILAARSQARGGRGMWATRLVRGADGSVEWVPTAEARMLEDAAARGITSDPEVMAELNAIADLAEGAFADLGSNQLIRGGTRSLRRDYIPITPTRQANETARRFADAVGPSNAKVAASVADPTVARRTDLIRFTGPDGRPNEIMALEWDRFNGITAADIERVRVSLGPELAGHLADAKKRIDDFRAVHGELTDELIQTMGRPMGPLELSNYVSEGALQGLFGGAVPGGRSLFEDDLPTLLAGRVAADRVAEAEDGFFRDVVTPFALTLDVPRQHVTQAGKTARLADGTQVTSVGGGRFKIGDRTYRYVNIPDDYRGDMVDVERLFRDGLDYTLLPDTIASEVERFMEVVSPRNRQSLFRAVEGITRAWRGSTLLHPSWHVINAFGNTALLMMSNPDLLADPRRTTRLFRQALRLIRHDRLRPLWRNGETITIGDQVVSPFELMEAVRNERVIGQSNQFDAMYQVFGRDFLEEAAAQRATRTTRAGLAKATYQARVDQILAEMAAQGNRYRMADGPRQTDRLRAHFRAARDSADLGKLYRGWFNIASFTDDTFRLVSFLKALEDGNDIASSAAIARRQMLNFGDMTDLERRELRTLMPFYSWLRASFPNMVRRLRDNPEHISLVPKTVNAIEEATVGDDALPVHMRPTWVQQAIAAQIATEGPGADTLLLGTALPQEAAIRAVAGAGGLAGLITGGTAFDGQDFLDLIGWFGGQVGPAKIPLELTAGREFFSGRTIGPNQFEGDLSVNEYLLNQIRQARELGIGSTRQGPLVRAFEEGGIAGGLGRLAIGGRLQYTVEEDRRQRFLAREMADKVRGIRRAFNLAQREGRDDVAQEAAARLLTTYRDFAERGIDASEIPKWAREQLAGLIDAPEPEGVAP